MKKYYYILIALLIGGFVCSCDDDDPIVDPNDGEVDYGDVKAQFIAKNFDGEVINSIDMGELVTFFDVSEGRPDKREWELDGAVPESSDRVRTSVRYPKPGKYHVGLKVERTSDGAADALNVPDYIEILSIPIVARFATDVVPDANGTRSIKTGDYITFTDLSTGVPENSAWEFSGGTPVNSDQSITTIRYEVAGEYDVKLTSSRNDNGTIVSDDTIAVGAVKVIQRVIDLKRVVVDGNTIEAWFNEPLMAEMSGAVSDFSVSIETASGSTLSPSISSIVRDNDDDKKIIVTIGESTYDDDIVRLILNNTGSFKDATLLTNVTDFDAVCCGIYDNIWTNDPSFEEQRWWLKSKADENGNNGFEWYIGEIQYDGSSCVRYAADAGVTKKQMLSPQFTEPWSAGDYYFYFRVYIETGSIEGWQFTLRSPWIGNVTFSGQENLPTGRWVEVKKKVYIKSDVGTGWKKDYFFTTLPSPNGVVMYIDDIGIHNSNLRP